jgi:hypothetical protein
LARKEGAGPNDRKFSDALSEGDDAQQAKATKASQPPLKSSRPDQANQPDRAAAPAKPAGQTSGLKADGNTEAKPTAERSSNQKAGRSQSLERVGALVRLGGEPAKSSDALALLTGNQSEIDPTTIPQIVTENKFIGAALGDGITEVMSKTYAVAEIIEKLDISPRVIEQAKAQGLDLDEKVNAIDFFKAIGIDPQRIVVELTRLKDGLSKDGLSSLMARPTAFGDKQPTGGLPQDNMGSEDLNMRRKRNQGPDIINGASPTMASPVIANPVLPVLNSAPSRAPVSSNPAMEPSSSFANSKSLLDMHSEQRSLNLGTFDSLTETIEFTNPSVGTASGASDLFSAVTPGTEPEFAPKLQGEFPELKSAGEQFPKFESDRIPGAGIDFSSNSMAATPHVSWTHESLSRASGAPTDRGIRRNSIFDMLSGEMRPGSLNIQSLTTDLGPTKAMSLNPQGLADQLSRTRLGLDSSIQFAKIDQNNMPVAFETAVPIQGELAVTNGEFNSIDNLAPRASGQPSAPSLLDQSLQKGKAVDLDLGPKIDGFVRGAEGFEGKPSDSFLGEGAKEKFDSEPKERAEFDASALAPSHFEKSVHHLAKAADSGKPDAMSNELANRIMDRISDMARDKRSEAVIHVDSPEMGRVTIALQMQDNQVSLRLVEGSEKARQLLGADLTNLQDALAAQNLKLADVDMSAGRNFSNSADQGHLRQQMQQQFSQQNSSRGRILEDFAPKSTGRQQVANIARSALGRAMSTNLSPGRIQVMA